ncbi:uncharacterized protein LOC123322592 [Coccinella septempunctata]|uniref:uncharacterized protein LOC123322592 n=1 Tax=Coccinella septempunctata TaxID=41139 RepID=UPI001D05CB39|nr:uncharacterized protein LOC123322592 [Coccinella septempunctata]
MSHSKSCRCKLCCSSPPDCNSCYPDCCSYHWKNRFCKLRKQWSPCDKTVGRFGVAWVAEIPDCENEEPKGWQVEIIDTSQGILKKCKELIDWLNNPPAHLFDNIKGNETSTRYPKCNLNTCDESWEEPCSIRDTPKKCEEIRVPKRCKINCSEEKVVECIPHCGSQTCLNDYRSKCKNRNKTCHSECCEENIVEYLPRCDSQTCLNDNRPKCKNRTKTCHNKCCGEKVAEYLPCCDSQTCLNDSHPKCKNRNKTCHNKYCEEKIVECLPCDTQTCLNDNRPKCKNRTKTYHNKYCEDCRPKTSEDCSDRESSKSRHSRCHWSTSVPNEGDDGVFRKESCCCQCHEKFFKNVGTTYEIDIVPQRDHTENTIKSITSQMSELDSKIICAGIRTSQICKKVKEERRNQLIEKHEKELNTVIANGSTDEEATKSLYMSSQLDNQSVMNSKLIANSIGSQRRSSKFRRKEST